MKKIFLLDDNAELIEIIQIILKDSYDVKCRDTADTVVQDVVDFQPDIILIDHFIGDTQSGNVIQQLQSKIPEFNIPVILFSASHNVEYTAREIGAAGFIEKPASISHIRDYVSKMLDK